jgi:hypothetical protein
MSFQYARQIGVGKSARLDDSNPYHSPLMADIALENGLNNAQSQ